VTARPPSPAASGHPAPLAHLPSLDGLRGIAILLVLLHNFDVLDLGGAHALGPVLVKECFYIGWIGVQLFFVLSGYLITRGLLVTQDQPDYFERFFLKRVLRIFPLYYLALLVFLVLLPATGWVEQRSMQYSPLWLWAYLSNWTTPFEPTGGPLPHFWSLAVEEQFYLVWPLLLWKLRLRHVWWLCLGLTALSPLLRLLLVRQGFPDEALYEFTFSRMDALAGAAALRAVQLRDLRFPQAAAGPRRRAAAGALDRPGAHGGPRCRAGLFRGRDHGHLRRGLAVLAPVRAPFPGAQRPAVGPTGQADPPRHPRHGDGRAAPQLQGAEGSSAGCPSR
jgi:peptidoglycan/LPS O-acetylase OafA/YrhL